MCMIYGLCDIAPFVGHMTTGAEGVGQHSEGVPEQGSGNVLDGGSTSVLAVGPAAGVPSQGSLGHTVESVNVEQPYMLAALVDPYVPPPLEEGRTLVLEPTASVDDPPTPTELSVQQQVALGSLRGFFTHFKRYPPTSLLTARTPSSAVLAFVQDSGYPVRQIEALLERVLASCSEYAVISTKNPLVVVREACVRRLKKAEETLAATRYRVDELYVVQEVTLSSLESAEAEYVTASKQAEELRHKLETLNTRAAELKAQIPFLEFTSAAQDQALQDLYAYIDQLGLTLAEASDKVIALQDDVPFCVTSHVSLLHDAEARARADLEAWLSSFPSIEDQTF